MILVFFPANNVSVSPVVVCIWENLHTSRAKVFTLRPHEYSFYGTEIILYYFLWKVSNERWSKYFSNNISSHHRTFYLPQYGYDFLDPTERTLNRKKWNWIHAFLSTEECVEQPSVISDGHSDKNIMFNFSEIEEPSVALTSSLSNEIAQKSYNDTSHRKCPR